MAPSKIWLPLDTGFLGDQKVGEMGAQFGAGGPLAFVAMLCAAKLQNENGRFQMSFKALSRAAFLSSPKRSRDVISLASELRLIELISIGASVFEARVPSWDQWQKGASTKGARRTRRYRDRLKVTPENVTGARHGDSTVTDTDNSKQIKEKTDVFSSSAIGLCDDLAQRIIDNGSKPPTITDSWLKSADLLLHTDSRPVNEAHDLIEWCQGDDFWKGNVLSMPTFRKQYDKLRLASQRTGRPRHLQAVDKLAIIDEIGREENGDAA